MLSRAGAGRPDPSLGVVASVEPTVAQPEQHWQGQGSVRATTEYDLQVSVSKETQDILERAFRLGVHLGDMEVCCVCFYDMCSSLLSGIERSHPLGQGLDKKSRNTASKGARGTDRLRNLGQGRGSGLGFGGSGSNGRGSNQQKPSRSAGVETSSMQAESFQRKLLGEKIDLLNSFLHKLLGSVR